MPRSAKAHQSRYPLGRVLSVRYSGIQKIVTASAELTVLQQYGLCSSRFKRVAVFETPLYTDKAQRCIIRTLQQHNAYSATSGTPVHIWHILLHNGIFPCCSL